MRGLNRVVQGAIVGAAGLAAVGLAGVIAFGLYVHHAKSPRFAAASTWNAPASAPAEVVHTGAFAESSEDRRSFVGDLEFLADAGEFGDLGAMAMELAPTLDPSSRQAGIRWFEERMTWGRAPSLFILSRLYAAEGDMTRASEWYMAGSLCYRIDAECVADPTARQAATILEAEMKEIRARLRDDPKEVERSIGWALEFEELHSEREPAYWIAAHGLGAFASQGQPPAEEGRFLGPRERNQARAKLRRAFETMRDEAGGQASSEAAAVRSGRTSS